MSINRRKHWRKETKRLVDKQLKDSRKIKHLDASWPKLESPRPQALYRVRPSSSLGHSKEASTVSCFFANVLTFKNVSNVFQHVITRLREPRRQVSRLLWACRPLRLVWCDRGKWFSIHVRGDATTLPVLEQLLRMQTTKNLVESSTWMQYNSF
jgi:hypothetical protein